MYSNFENTYFPNAFFETVHHTGLSSHVLQIKATVAKLIILLVT